MLQSNLEKGRLNWAMLTVIFLYHQYTFDGIGVEQNWEKTIYHLEQASIAGHAHAMHNLGCAEKDMGRFQRDLKHYIIASNLGHDSMQELRTFYAAGELSKEDFATAIRAHQAAIDATKSVQRSKAAAALDG